MARNTSLNLDCSEHALNASGISVAPPMHLCSSAASAIVPQQVPINFWSRRSDMPSTSATKKAMDSGSESSDESQESDESDHLEESTGIKDATKDTKSDLDEKSESEEESDSDEKSNDGASVEENLPLTPPSKLLPEDKEEEAEMGEEEEDTVMGSPTNIPLEGSSCTTGGIARGQALGNTLNHADFGEFNLSQLDIALPTSPPHMGKVWLFVTESQPSKFDLANAKPDMTTKATISKSIEPILSKIGKLYSPIKNKNHRVFVLDDDKEWMGAGCFSEAINSDLELLWEKNKDNHTNKTLTYAYAKWRELIKAQNTLGQLKSNGQFPSTKKSIMQTMLVKVFVAKSTYHESYQLFSHVQNHQLMIDWLENGNDHPADRDVWGTIKMEYSWNDLSTWLTNADKETSRKRKGKAGEKSDKKKKEGKSKK
ncbi:hypothetical protein BJ912DRAFT_930940 [Pholiota molesta]|nr:hypothetical protein BJ912DRAFT_930940 [Pholiota molesta]